MTTPRDKEFVSSERTSDVSLPLIQRRADQQARAHDIEQMVEFRSKHVTKSELFAAVSDLLALLHAQEEENKELRRQFDARGQGVENPAATGTTASSDGR